MKGKFRPFSPAMIVAIVALVSSLAGPAVADEVARIASHISGGDIRNNSVSGADIRNNSLSQPDFRDGGIQSRDIGTGQVQTADLGDNAVRGDKIQPNTIDGSDIIGNSLGSQEINEGSLTVGNSERLGGLPPAAFTSSAEVRPFRVRLSFGQKVEFLTNGPVGLEADCRANITGSGQDELRLLAVSRVDNAFMQGDTPHGGPGAQSSDPYLGPDTPEDERTMGGLVSLSSAPDEQAAEDDIDTGFVAGPNGEYIGIDETTMYALRVGGSDCLLVGIATVLEP
jgi:hypothetical protein